MKKETCLRGSVHLSLLMPMLWLVYLIVTNEVGPDPAERIVKYLGFTGACVLWLSLSMTPLRWITATTAWIAYRRALGLWAFAYLCMHFLGFVVIWAGLDGSIILEELTKRPYMYIGLVAWLMLLPLAATSTRSARRRLGRRWSQLHKLVYPAAMLGLVHMAWVAKLDYLQPAIFALTLFLLLLSRLIFKRK